MDKHCECGCGEKVRRRFVVGHNNRGIKLSLEHRRRISEGVKGIVPTKETRLKISKSLTGQKFSDERKRNISAAKIGKKATKQHKLSRFIGRMKKCILLDGYCHQWGDREYRDDLRKKECSDCGMTEKASLLKWGMRLSLHHKDGDKEHCHPYNIDTLCVSCHIRTDWKIRKNKKRLNL